MERTTEEDEIPGICPNLDRALEDKLFDEVDKDSSSARLPRCKYVDAWCKVSRDERTGSCRHYWECARRNFDY